MASLFVHLWSQAPFYEVIHVHLAGSPAVAAALAGRLLGKRVVVKLGGGAGIGELAVSSRSALGRLKLRLLARLRPQFVAVARELSEEAARYLGAVPVHIVPNGVDVGRYRPGAAPKAEARARLGWPQDGLCFLYVGRFSPEKRLSQFVETWADALRGSRAKAFVALVGEGVDEQAVLTSARAALASERVFIHAPVEDVERVYAAADVFALPSVSEGLSNALLEAMASGLAPLASRVGGTPDAVEDAQSGLLFPPEDFAALRAQIGKLLAKPELVASLGRAAREKAVERFSVDSVARRYEEIYRWGLP
jgi:glycosyltransferase involved in cell wall biosynthesis